MNHYVVFEEYKTNSPGIWFYVPNDGKFANGKSSQGFGTIKYEEGSVYTGEIYYDGNKFHKLGFGQQDFSKSTIGRVIPEINERRSLFVGNFDYEKTNWIYGNGVWYFTDVDGKPSHFIKGFFSNLQKIGEYNGSFDYSLLIDGYTKDMEFDFDEKIAHYNARIDKYLSTYGNPKVIFIGDSYFEFGDDYQYASSNLISKKLPNSCLNVGIGGSTFFDWNTHIETLKGRVNPNIVVINLGFNDIHQGLTFENINVQRDTLLKKVREYFPNAKIYMLCVVHAPAYESKREIEIAYNQELIKDADALNVIARDYGPKLIQSAGACFYKDNIHLNSNGYKIFIELLKSIVSENSITDLYI